ncbi:MAG: dihydropteroate synthase [Legionellaceae bacterium]|nr:dihydropteroate synthase [Legionellaceae bacterium]
MNKEQFAAWRKASQRRSLVMGILNITPDSFHDGGQFIGREQAYKHAQSMIDNGVDLIDIGGESSKPGAKPISLDEELNRVIPVIERICASTDMCISIDTTKPMVMQEAIKAGAAWINDIGALTTEDALVTAAQLDVPICLMHMQGKPECMQQSPHYETDVIDEINYFFEQRIHACLEVGIARDRLILDPGFGFGKSVQHNIELIRRFHQFKQHQLPLLLGVSRKSTIGNILDQPLADRLAGGLALTTLAVMQGASIIRTHDVIETKQTLKIVDVVGRLVDE